MTPHLSAAILHTSASVLPLVAVVGVPLAWLTLGRHERSALTYRAVVAFALAVGLASVVGRLPLDLTTYAAVAAALLVPLRRRMGCALLLLAALGALARGDLEVHQRPVVLGGLAVGVLAAVVGTVVWQQLDPLPRAGSAGALVARRPGWLQLFAPSPVDLDHLDAIIDGTQTADDLGGQGPGGGRSASPDGERGEAVDLSPGARRTPRHPRTGVA